MQPNAFLCFALSNVLVLINLSWSLYIRVTFVSCSNILMLFGIRVSLPIRPTSLKKLKKGLWELFLVLIIFHMLMLWMCDVDRLSARREQHSLKFEQSLPKCSRTSKLLPPCRGKIHGRQLRNNAKLTQPRARTIIHSSLMPIPLSSGAMSMCMK